MGNDKKGDFSSPWSKLLESAITDRQPPSKPRKDSRTVGSH